MARYVVLEFADDDGAVSVVASWSAPSGTIPMQPPAPPDAPPAPPPDEPSHVPGWTGLLNLVNLEAEYGFPVDPSTAESYRKGEMSDAAVIAEMDRRRG